MKRVKKKYQNTCDPLDRGGSDPSHRRFAGWRYYPWWRQCQRWRRRNTAANAESAAQLLGKRLPDRGRQRDGEQNRMVSSALLRQTTDGRNSHTAVCQNRQTTSKRKTKQQPISKIKKQNII